MKTRTFRISSLLLLTASLTIGAHAKAAPTAFNPNPGDTVVVYMVHAITPESLVKIYNALERPASSTDKVAVKISTGEDGGNNYLKPELIEKLVKSVRGTIVECNTAYPGNRNTTKEHWKTINHHGFPKIAKVDIMDEDGDMQIPVVDTTHIKYNLVGKHLKNYTYMINLAHFKGHQMAGFGGVLKNQSIGVASSHGKANIHSAGATTSPTIMWTKLPQQDAFLESMAAAAQAVANYFGPKIVYINVMNNISIDCDCNNHPAEPELQDIGILASTDPVALDQACLDIIYSIKTTVGNNPEPLKKRIEQQHGAHVVDYAAQIGLGSKVYKIVYLD